MIGKPYFFGTALFVLAVVCALQSTHAEAPRVANLHAMVIGNGNYKEGKLANPANDAQVISSALSELGFKVTVKTDLPHHEMDMAITKFCQEVNEGGLAFFFFAGHGIQVNGENYLIPVDAEIPDESFVKYKSVSLSLILDSLGKSRSNMNVVVLDCCRNNPFERNWKSRGAIPRGLAPQIDIPEGTIIAYATSPGKTAADGDGSNSPYTKELASALMQRPRTGLLLRDVFFTASRAVKEKTGQSPWVNMEASLDNFYLRPSEESAVVPSPHPESTFQSPKENGLAEAKSQGHPLEPLSATPALQMQFEDKALVEQAAVYLRQGQYDNAISAYTAILENPSLPAEARKQIRKSRGAAYLGRGAKSDINQAIIDHLAAGLNGIQLTVRTEAAELQTGEDKNGKVSRGQVLQVTRSMTYNASDWFWVAAVNGDETLTGWVKAAAVVKTSDGSAPATEPSKPSHPASNAMATQAQPIQSEPVSAQPRTSLSPNQSVLQQPTYQQPGYVPQTSYDPSRGNSYSMQGTNQGFSQTTVPQQSTQRYVPSTTANRTNQGTGNWQPLNQSQGNNQWQMNSNNRSQMNNQPQMNNQWQSTNGNGNGIWRGNSGLQQNSGVKNIWATPKWESPAEIRRGISNGTLKW